MKEVVTRQVGEHEYIFSQFGAKKSTKTLIRIAKMVGKPITLAMSSAVGSGSILERKIDLSLLSQAVEALTQNLDEDASLKLIEELIGGDAVLCDGKKIDFDTHYQGRLEHMFAVLNAALEVQYGNFFVALSAFLPSPPQPQTQDPAM